MYVIILFEVLKAKELSNVIIITST
jgi:hypothetical protein